MARLDSQIQALINYANETTGKEDTHLGDAVKSLADGYKGGGTDYPLPTITDADALSSQLTALIAYANGITGKADTQLGNAVRSLVEGYGGGAIPYRECAYLSATNGPYIDTGISESLIDSIEITIIPNVPFLEDRHQGFLGSRDTGGNGGITIYNNVYGGFRFTYNRNTFNMSSKERKNISSLNIVLDREFIKINDNILYKTQARSSVNETMLLFANRNANGSVSNDRSYCTIPGHVIFRSNGNEICHLIPCLDNNDIPCLYDIISKKTLYNLGTKEFGYELK